MADPITVVLRPPPPTKVVVEEVTQKVIVHAIDPLAPTGPMGPQGPPGPPGSSGAFVHVQSTPDSAWIVNHNLGYRPDVSVIVGGVSVDAAVTHVSANQLTVDFSAPYVGEARCT